MDVSRDVLAEVATAPTRPAVGLTSYRDRHGHVRWRFRRQGRSVAVKGAPGEARFERAIVELAAMPELPQRTAPVPPALQPPRGPIQRTLATALRRAKHRRNDRPFDITLDWLTAEVEANDFRCALTGIPFKFDADFASHINPYVPSLDRIDPRGGYTKDNVRVVLGAVNIMLSDWGVDVFEWIAEAYRAQKGR